LALQHALCWALQQADALPGWQRVSGSSKHKNADLAKKMHSLSVESSQGW
jgi:hypothetical protein